MERAVSAAAPNPAPLQLTEQQERDFLAGRDRACDMLAELLEIGTDDCMIDRWDHDQNTWRPGRQTHAMRRALAELVAEPDVMAGFVAVLTDVVGVDPGWADPDVYRKRTPQELGIERRAEDAAAVSMQPEGERMSPSGAGEVILPGERVDLALRASYELEAIAGLLQLIAGRERASDLDLLRGLSIRVSVLGGVVISAIDDEQAQTVELRRALFGHAPGDPARG